MGDPVDIITDIGLNLVTGGFYSIGKAAAKTVETGDPMPLFTQGLDIGVSALGNDIAGDIGGDSARIAYNLSGLAAGLAGGGAAGLSPTGFGADVAPLAATPGAAIPVASGVAPTAADVASVGGNVGATAAPAAAPTAGEGGLANLVGLPAGKVSTTEGASLALPNVAKSLAAPETAGYLNEIKAAAPALEKAGSAQGWFSSLSPGAQTALVTGGFVGGQTIMGGMQGLFAGTSAQKKLELEKLINAQYQQQIQYKNKNNAYAPLLMFKQPGFVQTPVAGNPGGAPAGTFTPGTT